MIEKEKFNKVARCLYCKKVLPEGTVRYCNDDCKAKRAEASKRYRNKPGVKDRIREYQNQWYAEHRKEWNAYMSERYNKNKTKHNQHE